MRLKFHQLFEERSNRLWMECYPRRINALLRDLGADGADNQENVITEHLTDAKKMQ